MNQTTEMNPMQRSEYMRQKGELLTASEDLSAIRAKKSAAQEGMQNWVNQLRTTKISPQYADQARRLIDDLEALQQQHDEAEARERQYQAALKGMPVPPQG